MLKTGGRELPEGLRQKVISGTLYVNSVQKDTDAGVYECWARNKQGQTARRRAEVAVIGRYLFNFRYYKCNLCFKYFNYIILTCVMNFNVIRRFIKFNANIFFITVIVELVYYVYIYIVSHEGILHF